VLIISLAGVWGAGFFFLPRYVQNSATEKLESLGFEVKRLSVARLSFSQATIAGIRLTLPDGVSTLTVNAVDAEFSISSILEGKVDRVILHGADLDLRSHQRTHASARAKNSVSRSDEGLLMPVRELNVASASIRAHRGPFIISSLLTGAFQWKPEEKSIAGTMQIDASISGSEGRRICEFESADVIASLSLHGDMTFKSALLASTIPDLRILGHHFRNTEFQIQRDSSQLSYDVRSHGETFQFDEIRGNYSLNKSLLINVKSPSITNGGFSTSAQEAKFSMGFSTNAALEETASVSFGDPVLLNCPIPDFSGKILYGSGILEATFQPAAEADDLPSNTFWRVSNRDDPSILAIRSPLLNIHPDGAVGSCLQSKFDVQVHAGLLVTGRIPLRNQPGGPTLHFDIRNGSLETGSMEIEDLRGEVELEIKNGIRSPGRQVLDVGRVKLGRLQLENGHLEFSIESADSILLEKMEWSVFGGRMTSLATRFARSNPITRLDLVCEELNLVDVLNTVFNKNFTGSGMLFGRLPIKVRRSPKPGIAFGDGYLYSRPGKGTLGFGESPDVQAVIEQGILRDRSGLELEEVRKQVSQTLQDFEYTSLIMKIGQTSGGRPYGTLDIDGKGAHEHGVPIQFEIRFSVKPL
jgi:hypothetical protein